MPIYRVKPGRSFTFEPVRKTNGVPITADFKQFNAGGTFDSVDLSSATYKDNVDIAFLLADDVIEEVT